MVVALWPFQNSLPRPSDTTTSAVCTVPKRFRVIHKFATRNLRSVDRYFLDQGGLRRVSSIGCISAQLLSRQLDSATLVTLLRRAGKDKALSHGRLLHVYITTNNYENTHIGNCVIEMYGSCGSVEDARAVFDTLPNPNLHSWCILMQAYVQNGSLGDARSVFSRIPERNVVSWNTMISAYSQNRHGKEALDLFHKMQLEDTKPNVITFVCALDACASFAAIDEGKKLHAAILYSDHELDVVVGTALVNMYGSCRSLEDARSVFGKIPRQDIISWTAMIGAYAQNGKGEEALELFQQMQLDGVEPNKVSYVCALDVCASTDALDKGKGIHAAILHRNFEQDVGVGTALVNMYGKCGSMHDADIVFCRMPQRNILSWNTMISACAHNGQEKEGLHHFHMMQLEGIKPEKITLICALDACASLAALEEGKKIHTTIVDSGYDKDIVLANALVNVYGKCGRLDNASIVFDTMPQQDVVSWNAMIAACTQNGHEKEAFHLFDQMQYHGIKPDEISFTCALDACASLAALDEGFKIHSAVVNSSYEEAVTVGNALITMYGNCGNLHDAMQVFHAMPHLNVVTWNAVIAACTQNGHAREALNLLPEMQLKGVKPNDITFISSIDACAHLAALKEGYEIHAAIVDSGYVQEVVVGNSLVNMYGKCGSLIDARSVFSRMYVQDVVSWNAMISACAQNGHDEAALELFHQMQIDCVKPDEVTFLSVLTACSHSGRLDDGSQYFISMNRDYGLFYTLEHYGCMIDLLGRAGELDVAEDLVNIMPFNKGASAWSSLLSACRIHEDLERGVRVAKHCLELDPKNHVLYIMLSNMYATAEMG